jgi:hypothetical protein
VVEIVNDPGGEVLAERHGAKLRMPPPTFEIGGRQTELAETRQAVGSSGRERVKELLERTTTRRIELCETIEWWKWERIAMREDVLDARDPIRPLSVDQMSDDVERVPGAGAFGLDDPWLRQSDQQLAQGHRSPAQKRERCVEVERHVPALDYFSPSSFLNQPSAPDGQRSTCAAIVAESEGVRSIQGRNRGRNTNGRPRAHTPEWMQTSGFQVTVISPLV